jgi:uncharacterized protein
MTDIREDRVPLFRNLEHPDTQGRFWERVAADVDWTVEGTHPLAGRYCGKKEFIQASFERLGRLMKDGVRLKLEGLYVDGDMTIAELREAGRPDQGSLVRSLQVLRT